jgi:hypothetical protein
MDFSTRITFVAASVVAALLMLLFGGGIATGTMMSGTMMRSGLIGNSGGIWFPALFCIALGVLLFALVFRKA